MGKLVAKLLIDMKNNNLFLISLWILDKLIIAALFLLLK